MDFFWYSAQASFSWPRVDLARLVWPAYSRPFWITSFEFVKVCGIRFSIWESFIGFYICCYPITTILACLFSVGVRISWKKLCWMRAWRRRWHLLSPTLYIIIVYRVNLNKLSRNFVGVIRTTPTDCRVSFIDFSLVFPSNFKIIFLPHTNTVILLEPYCGTITVPGLPVVSLTTSWSSPQKYLINCQGRQAYANFKSQVCDWERLTVFSQQLPQEPWIPENSSRPFTEFLRF